MYVHAPEFGGARERVRIAIPRLRCASGVWTACWVVVMAQMVVAPMPMLHLSEWDSARAAVESSGAKVSFRLRDVIKL